MAKGWLRRKKGKLLYCWNNTSGQERSKVLGPQTLANEDAWLEVGRRGLDKLVGQPDPTKPTVPTKPTFSQIAKYYFENKGFKKHSTKSLHQQIVDCVLVPEFGNDVAVEIKPKRIKLFLKGLEISDATRAKYRAVMSAVYSFVIAEEELPQTVQLGERDLVSANPCSRVKGFSSESDYEAMILEPDQTFRVLELLKQPEFTLLLLIAVTGLRMSEALGLCWRDVVLDKGAIRIRRTYVHNVMQEGAKTRASKSSLEIHPLLAKVLQSWKEETLYSKPEDYVFPSYKLKGKKPRNGSMIVEHYLRPAALKTGVIAVNKDGQTVDAHGEEIHRFGFHTFRHSLASTLMAEGENPAVVQGMLRHARLDMTMYYAHAQKKQKREAQGKMLGALLPEERVLERVPQRTQRIQ